LAYDKDIDEDSGIWFTEDPIMAKQYGNCGPCYKDAEKLGLDVYRLEIEYDINEKRIIREEVWSGKTVKKKLRPYLDEYLKKKYGSE
jgi:hypothetical protein